MAEENLCQVCNLSWDWHQEHKPKHRFIGVDETPILVEDKPPPTPTVSRAGDPVLRLALIHAGILTEGELTQATQWMEAARQEGKALLVLPTEDGGMKYVLMDINEAMTAKAGS